MFALPGIAGLVVFILARPFDFVEGLRGVPLLYVFFALALLGVALDLRLGVTRLRAVPTLPWVVAFLAWCVVTATLQAPDTVTSGALTLAIALAIFVLVAHGIQSFKSFEVLMAAVLISTLFICVVCVHQGSQPLTCVAVDQSEDHSSMGRPDGRSCETPEECYVDPPEPQAVYRCEHAGILGVTSIAGGRVRYVGVLHDPNEVALAVSAAVPFAVAFYERKRSRGRLLLMIVAGLLAAITVILSKSRGGLLVFMAAVGVYFLRRYKWKGLIAGSILALPVALLGGREDAAASASTSERLECWYEGLEMFRAYPLTGVGFDQFTEHHHLTAHNSLILAAAENGILGTILWCTLMYLSAKIPLHVLRTVNHPEAQIARSWAMALLASLVGILVGVLFLSFNYHYVLWIYLGLAGALWSAVRAHQPGFTVPLGWRDAALLGTVVSGLLAGIFVYTRMAV
jgi:hypothetical protein